MSEWVNLALLIRPQGRKGELLADILTDFPERFSERRHLYLRRAGEDEPSREVTLESHWLHKDRIVLKFAGVDSMNDAESLRGFEVVIPKQERAPLDEDAAYIEDLLDCELIDRTRGRVGNVVDVDRESTLGALLVVDSSAGEVLVPFVKAYEPVLNLPAKTITMTLPDGLIEINTAPVLPDEAEGGEPPAPTRSGAE